MKQQVNLLAPMFRKARVAFGAPVTAGILLLVAGALALIYAGTAWHNGALGREQRQLETRRDTVTRQLDELAVQLRSDGKSETLEAERAQLAATHERKAQAFETLSRRELGSSEGFSPRFMGLARQRLKGLWLTRIEFSAGGGQMTLRGAARDEALLPRYLRQLGNEPVFAGAEFEHAVLERGAAPDAPLSFELRTRLEAAERVAEAKP